MTSQTSIANRALEILGDASVTDINDNNVRAKALKLAYDPVRRGLLRSYKWNFARKRAILAPDTTAPLHTLAYAYTWPADAIRILPQRDDTDWVIEGRKILTDTGTQLNIIYIYNVTDTNEFDDAFAEAFSAKLAMETVEKITGSATKGERAERAFDKAILTARRIAAFEQQPEEPPDDDWLLARL